jgi:hypothetical protein
MRRSLPRLVRNQTTRRTSTMTAADAGAGNRRDALSGPGVAFRRSGAGHPSNRPRHRSGRVFVAPSSTYAPSPSRPAVAGGARDLPPPRDRAGLLGDDRDGAGGRVGGVDARAREGFVGVGVGDGRRAGRGRNDDRRNDDRRTGDPLSPSYISDLSRRAEEQIRTLPVHPPIGGAADHDGDGVASLSSWYRSTAELIMLMSKLWGRGNDHRAEDPRQFLRVVTLASDLLEGFMTLNENEIDAFLLRGSGSAGDCGTPPNDDRRLRPPRRHPRGDVIGHRDRMPDLCTEILCQAVVLGWSRCDPAVAGGAPARNSQAILERLEGTCRGRGRLRDDGAGVVTFDARDVTPTRYLYNHVLSCWSRSPDPDAVERAWALLDRMESRARGDDAAFSRPDTFSYNNVLNLHASRGDVVAAEALLRRMEGSADGPHPDVYSYSITMNAFQKRFTSSLRGDRDMKDLERAEEILSRLAYQYERSGFRDVRLRPTNVTFGTIMSMYAQADRMLKRDNRESHKTRKWRADHQAANNADDAKNVGWGAKNAERVLDWMIGLCERERRSKCVVANSGVGIENVDVRHGGFNHDNELIRPNAHNFVTVMDAWAKAGKGVEGAQHCQRLLDRLVSLYEKFGYVELRPNPKVRLCPQFLSGFYWC